MSAILALSPVYARATFALYHNLLTSREFFQLMTRRCAAWTNFHVVFAHLLEYLGQFLCDNLIM